MRILHITNGYIGSSLYKLFFTQLSKYLDSQSVFIPIRNENQKDIFKTHVDSINSYYHVIVNSIFYRIFFHLKIRKEIKSLLSSVNVSDYQLIHAHTLFSDGAVAYGLYKEFNIPYVIAVRNTDINVFLKYFVHLRNTGKEIIRNAKKIVFLSKSYKTKLLFYYSDIADIIEQKTIVIPNGIDEFWYNHEAKPKTLQRTVNLIFTGEIRYNKNIHGIIKALDKLSDKCKITFTIVGEGLNDEKRYLQYLKMIIKSKPDVKILKAATKEELVKLYQESSVFVMPSFKESFGLVYAEALSQNLPVIYTQNEGFDGWFNPGEVGYPVNPNSTEDLADKLMLILENYDKIQQNISSIGRYFSWGSICEKYYTIYCDIIRK